MIQALTRLLFGLALAAIAVRTPVLAATDVVPFDAFGYRDTILERGPNAALSVYLPVTRGLRTIRLHAPIAISPQVDPRSSILVTANDVPVESISVRSAGRSPTIDVAIPVPADARSLSIAIVGRLFILGDICADPQLDDVYFTVSKNAYLTVTSDDRISNEQILDFLNQYGGAFDVVTRSSSDDARAATIQLAYRLHQIERWRRVTVRTASAPASDARTIVVGAFPNDLALHGRELDVTPHGVALLNDRIDRLLIAPKIAGATYTPRDPNQKLLTIDDLGVTTRTLRGSGEMPFDIPLTYGAFGGVPEHLRIHVDLTHTPIRPADRAFVQILVNNTLIGSYDMTGKNSVERFDVPLDVDAVSSSNVVRVVPTFFYERDACKGNYPSFTATLADDTNFQWDGISNRPLSVGEFVRAVSGRVVVLVDDPARDPDAFALVSAIGTVNSAIRSIDVQTFTGSIPAGYDYAIVLGSGDRVAGLGAPLQVNGQNFTIYANDGKTVRYQASYSTPFGVLQTTRSGGTPTLIATYWKNPAVLGGIANLNPDDLAAQTDNVLVFNAREATYSDEQRMPVQAERSYPIPLWLIVTLFVLLLIVVAVFAARRKA
jgi:hypothetical protein